MPLPQNSAQSDFQEVIRLRFFQRTILCLWLAIVFFPLFALLDFVYCRPYFNLFTSYRLAFVVTLLCFINLLKLPACKKYAPNLMYIAMVLGAFTIALMTVRLGGFPSGYYVGILLMIAGALSVLPVRASQAVFYGLSMYCIYMITVLLGTDRLDRSQLMYAVNNTFFFLAIVGIAAVQSFDDLRTLHKAHRAKESIRQIRDKLTAYTDGLEETVQQRLAELEESHLKYRDLYDNIMDLVVLVDPEGKIQQVNRHFTTLLGLAPESVRQADIRDYLRHELQKTDWLAHVLLQLSGNVRVKGVQLNLFTDNGDSIEVELSASRVEIDTALYYQLILRDISTTKRIESELLQSEHLVGTSRQAAIFGLARLAECRDEDTGAHLSRIRSYTQILAEELAKQPEFASLITERFIEEIGYSAVLHDIGKVGIPDAILLKPGRLTEDEYDLMKQHTVFGSSVLAAAEEDHENLSFLRLAQEIARSHHERWDAGGYPDGLSGDAIPLAARIISVADVYDALTSIRIYKPPFSHEESKEMILRESGRQFDPRVVAAFLSREEDFKESRMRMLLQQQPSEAGQHS